MKKLISYIGLSLLVLIAIGLYINYTTESIISARYKYDGRLVWPETIGSTQITNASIANADLATTAVDGGVMYEATRYMWFPCTADSAANDGWKGAGAWTLDGTNPPTVVELFGTDGTAKFTTFGFEADQSGTDDVAYLTFPCPDDYEANSMELYLYWFHLEDAGAATDTVEWQGAVNAVANGEDLMVGGTALTAIKAVATAIDSALYITNIDPEVEDIVAGDLITVELSVDVSDSDLDTGENAHLLGVKVTWEAEDN